MVLEKNYAILEIQNILLKAEVDASKYPADEDLYLAVAKEIYPQLEQVFRLVLEPAFNQEPCGELVKPVVDQQLELELEGLKENFNRVSEELLKVEMANESLHVNFKEHIESKEEQISWLRSLIESLAKE